MGVPPVLIHFSEIFHHEPSIWKYHHFSKRPYIINMFTSGLIVNYIYIYIYIYLGKLQYFTNLN